MIAYVSHPMWNGPRAHNEMLFLALIGVTLLLTLAAPVAAIYYRRYLPGPSRGAWVWTAWLLGVLTAIVFIYGHVAGRPPFPPGDAGLWRFIETCIAAGTWLFIVPLLVAQWQRWFAAGGAGLRQDGSQASVTGGDVVCVLGAAAFAWLGWQWEVWAGLALATIIVAAGPAVRLVVREAGQPAAATPAPLWEERQRVLKLLEEGRITADESAELLNALGHASAGHAAPMELSRRQRMLLVGAAVVLVGFLLPWYAVNPRQELSRMMGQQLNQNGPPMPPVSVEMPAGGIAWQVHTPSLYVSGGDVERGFGWLVLAASIGVAVMPFVGRASESTRRTVSLVLLGVGGVLVLYLVTQGVRHVHVGLALVLIGYAMQTVALLRPAAVEHARGLVSPAGV